MANLVQSFLLDDLNIRGAFVELDSEWQEVLNRRNYQGSIAEILGQATAASLLMSSNIKIKGKMVLQLQSDGDLSLLVIQSDNNLGFRSLAKYKKDLSSNDLTKISSKGVFVISIENNENTKPYQGLVSIDSNSISENLENYFNQSEQLKTLLVLRADGEKSAGILLQSLPDANTNDSDWERLKYLIDTLDLKELKNIDSKELIKRIFSEDDVTLYPYREAKFQCTCSDERTLGILSSLDIDELNNIVKEKESVTIGCDFCGKLYCHDLQTVEALLANRIYPN